MPFSLPQSVPSGDAERPDATEGTATLDEFKLTPGDSLQIQQLTAGNSERFAVRVIGLMKSVSVLVTAPALDGKLIFVREQQPFLVRAFSSLDVCAFRTTVLKVQHAPFPYLHLDYPDSVKMMRIRKSVRARVQIMASIHEEEGGRKLAEGRIFDISAGGARILSATRFGEKGKTVCLVFMVKLDDIEESICIPALIRSQTDEHAENGGRFCATGLQFENLGQQSRLLIMNLVYQYLLRENG